MCTGAELVPLILSAAGTGVGAYEQNRALKRQDQEAARGIQTQARLSREADARVRQQIADTNGANSQADAQSVEGKLLDAVRRNRTAQPAEAIGTGGSDRYAQDVTNSNAAGKTDIAQLITNLSRIDAPQLQRQREASGLSRTATDLGLIGLRSQGQDFLTRLRAGSIQPNPWVTGLGSLAQGAGAGMADSAVDPSGLPSHRLMTRAGRGAAPNALTRSPF